MYEYVVMGQYQQFEEEEVDSADSKKEAEFMLGEYRMAFGPSYHLWIEKRRKTDG